MQKSEASRRAALILAIFYYCIVIWGVILKMGSLWSIHDTHDYMHTITLADRFRIGLVPFFGVTATTLKENLLNAMLLAPLGVLFPIIEGRLNTARHLLTCFFLSLSIELFQLVYMFGAFATEDLITNTLGCLIGIALYKLLLPLGERGLLTLLRVLLVPSSLLVFGIAVQTAKLLPDYLYLFTCH